MSLTTPCTALDKVNVGSMPFLSANMPKLFSGVKYSSSLVKKGAFKKSNPFSRGNFFSKDLAISAMVNSPVDPTTAPEVNFSLNTRSVVNSVPFTCCKCFAISCLASLVFAACISI